jgi:hypothetical protein
MLLYRRRIRRLATAAGIGTLALLGTAVPASAAASVNLGPIGFGAVVVDPAHAHVFVSGPKANVIDELGYSGNLVDQISVPSPQGMVISGQDLYVVESLASPAGAVARIDLNAPTPAAVTLGTGLSSPQWIAATGGELWVTEASSLGGGWGNISEVDPSTGQVTEFPNNSAMQTIYEPDPATSPGDPSTLYVASDGESPGQVERVDVSSATPTFTTKSPFGDTSNIQGLAVSADGARVIPAAGATQDSSGYTHYQFLEYSGSTLASDGVIYPGAPYPSAVATSASGLVATGLDNGLLSNSGQPISDINVFPLGSSTPTFSAITADSSGDSNVRPHGLALEPAGTFLFAVTADDVYGTNTIFNSFPLQTGSTAPPTISCGATPAGWQPTNVTVQCTASDNSGSGLANPADASFSLSTSVQPGQASSSAMTGRHEVCDNDGGCATAGPIGPVEVDRSSPVVSCASGPSGWSDTNVSVSCTASDVGSGLANAADSSFTLATSVAAGSFSTSAMTATHRICDAVGNCTTAGPLGPFEVDLAPPTVTISSPITGSTVKARSTLIASYACADHGSGIAAGGCTGPVANGAPIDTSKTGTFSFTVTARDVAGNTTSKTVSYVVKR